MKASRISRYLVAAALVAVLGCTMKKQEAPEVSGPSEFGISLQISLEPDVLEQDGTSQSRITVKAYRSDGQPQANQELRAEIRVNGIATDFGKLSTRTARTANDGSARFVYTAPLGPPDGVDENTIVQIGITPVGTDFGNASMRTASLRLVPRGIVRPPADLTASFTFSPTNPTDNQDIVFDASTSKANTGIAAYAWDFGNGDTASGRTVVYGYREPGTYAVTLKIFDAYDRSASTTQSVSIAPGVNPTAAFAFSPEAPAPGQPVFFNAAQSVPAPGGRIVKYTWDFGDGSAAGSGQQVSHTYPKAGSYVVILTVTDDVGRKGTVRQTVPVAAP